MSHIEPGAEAPPLNWSDLGVSDLLPTGTVTLLLADVEGSTRLWETQPDAMTDAVARMNRAVSDVVDAHGGVRPLEQGEGDSFVAAFSRASDAVACALELQRAPLAPIKLRIGVHTGEIQLRDDANYAGPTINRTARLRDLAHGGQTVLSGVTESLVIDRLPADASLIDLGSHPLRDLPRPERVVQLFHPDLNNAFPPLRTPNIAASHNLPAQFTSFIGREAQMGDVRQMVIDNRLVTLTGAGGVGKTRLAVQVAAQLADEFDDGIWYVDLAPITDARIVPVTMARTLGIPDQPGRTINETLLRFLSDRRILLVLDNCEHLLDVCGELVAELLSTCPQVAVLATSREPLGMVGEVTWRVPSLSPAGEAAELFGDRARRARPDFTITDENVAVVTEICTRLDGVPLAIELAAARVRALSLTQILDSLHDRFRLLTGGARTAVRRQQTLRASVDWSHALLTEPERVLFRRLAVFMGGLDLDAAQAIAAASDVERFQVLDQLSLLVDKSLVVAEETAGRMRYRMLETVRQYALEKLGESGEADAVRTRHRDYYTATAAMLESLTRSGANQVVAWAQVEIDNLRAAFMWCRENSEFEPALGLVSSLQGFWQACGRFREGLAGFDAILDDECFRESDVARAVWVRAIAERSALAGWVGAPPDADLAQQALTIARELDDPALLATALIGCALARMDSDPVAAQPYFVEAGGLVRALGDWQRLCVILNFQGFVGNVMGDAEASLTAATEGRDVADAQGDAFNSRGCRVWIGMALMMQGRLADAASELRSVIPEADAANDLTTKALGLVGHGVVLAYQGHADAARSAAAAALEATTAMGGFHEDTVYVVFANAALAHGDSAAAKQAAEACWQHTLARREIFIRSINPHPEALLACGELTAARRWADEAVASVPGWHRLSALNARARIAIAQGDPEQAERDLYDAISLAAAAPESIHIPDTLECLSGLLTDADNCQSAARLFGAADAIRRHTGEARFAVYQAGHEGTVAKLRDALGEKDFEAAWAEGAALSTEEAIAYAQRGRGERKRPSTGWGSLTPTELDVVRQLQDGLGNKEIATRLFISPRTVQTHLTHVYSKLGITSRVQLAQEAARHN